MRTRVAVIGGGQNCEHEVSLASAASVAAALDPDRYDVVRLTIEQTGDWSVDGRSVGLAGAVEVLGGCDVVLPVLHGPRGEDGTVAALCDLVGVPYVGSGVRAGALAMDKEATKLVALSHGIATAYGTVVTAATADALAWDGPVVVKPVAAGSSQGVALVEEPGRLAGAVAAALALDDRVLVEEVVRGREIDLAVLGTRDGGRYVAPALEIRVPGFFDFTTKYDGSAEFLVPAALTDAELKELEDAAVTMYDALGCAGVARIDFFLTEHGPVLNEVNTMPGFTEQSQVPKMFAAAGTGYGALLDRLIRDVV
ncbi:MAG: D-alanine--D-alanine ligase [Microbacterium sp.]|nr:MAG: D-alanine--D-alanine ligase [Microbacterium sp.]